MRMNKPKPAGAYKAIPAKDLELNGNEFVIPDDPDEPLQNLGDYSILMYGRKKIGKTSVCSEFPQAFFLMTEPGGKGLRIRKSRVITSWTTFQKWINTVVAADNVDTVIVDTTDKAYDLCLQFVCKREGWKHPTDAAYGKGWNAVKTEFARQMDRLLASDKGVIFTSHAAESEFQTKSGGTFNRIIPTMSKQALEYVAGVVDIIAYFGYYGSKRLITIQGSEELEAGHRLAERFKTISGEQVHSIPMGPDKGAAYRFFVRAFNNELKNTGKPEYGADLGPMPVKIGRNK